MVTRKLTYLGCRVVQTEVKLPGGARQLLTYHVDQADPKNGGYPAGTTTYTVLKGNALRGTLQVIIPKRIIVTV